MLHKKKSELQRSPFFASVAILAFVVTVIGFIDLLSLQAIYGGYLSVMLFVKFIVSFGGGYILGVLSMARSRDAYGHARWAFLGFIPIANFWLIFTASKDELSVTNTTPIPLFRGTLGVVTGVVFVALAFAARHYLERETERLLAEAENDPRHQEAGLKMMVRGLGLEETLRQIAAEVPRERIDETTTLLRAVSDGTTLLYIFEVEVEIDALDPVVRQDIVDLDCSNETLRPLMEAGATLENLYQRSDGTKIEVVTITRDVCGF